MPRHHAVGQDRDSCRVSPPMGNRCAVTSGPMVCLSWWGTSLSQKIGESSGWSDRGRKRKVFSRQPGSGRAVCMVVCALLARGCGLTRWRRVAWANHEDLKHVGTGCVWSTERPLTPAQTGWYPGPWSPTGSDSCVQVCPVPSPGVAADRLPWVVWCVRWSPLLPD